MFLKIERERIPVGKIAEKSSLQPLGLFRFFNIWRAGARNQNIKQQYDGQKH